MQFVFQIICVNASTIVKTSRFFLSFNPENRVGKGLKMFSLSLSSCFPWMLKSTVELAFHSWEWPWWDWCVAWVASAHKFNYLWCGCVELERLLREECTRPSQSASGTIAEWKYICSTGKRLRRDLIYISVNCAQEVLSVKKVIM